MARVRSWTLRTAHPDDAGQVSALLARSYPILWAEHYESALLDAVCPLMARANPRLLASGTFFIILSDGGQAVGCGGWSHEAPGTGVLKPGVGHIRHFATDPDWLRLGIGAAILGRCIAEARAAGLAMLFAESAHGAEPFYAAFGMERQRANVSMIGGVALPGTMMSLAL